MNFYSKVSNIKALVFDIDGVLTDNSILVTDQGEFLRSFNVRDGYAIKRAIQAGLKIAVISGGRSMGTQKRLAILGIEDIYLGVENKFPVFQELSKKWNISVTDIAYMGDDILDIEILKNCGLPSCPADAVQSVLDICDFISFNDGGKGCVRDLIEKVLQAQNLW